MAVPKKKLSKSRRGMRRSHDGLKAANVIYCPYCGQSTIAHNVCRSCGTYAGKDTKSKTVSSQPSSN
ncbi:MAG: 50S ribosomal protein L32 [Alphaproteobacteria bacterium]|nr:50S ribosomal protein L32 [Alphaproteobacteria bacterium]